MTNVNDTRDGTQGGTQDKLQKQIFDMIEENPQISTSEIATKLGVGVRTVKRRIKQMTNSLNLMQSSTMKIIKILV